MRLGDDIDDYCSRCKRTTDHSVVTMEGDEVQRTRCRTCNYEHKYKHNRGSRELTAKQAYDKLLASVSGSMPAAPEPKSRKKK
jgi:ribosomal protein L44E